MRSPLVHLTVLLCAAQLATSSRAAAQHIPTAAHDLDRGATLTAGDILWVTPSDTDRTRGTAAPVASNTVIVGAADRDAIVAPGWTVRRPMRAGELLRRPSVAPPTMVVAGAPVDVLYRGDGITLKVHGVSIGDGAHGDVVYVKLDNRKRLRGVVIGFNTIQVL